MKKLLGSPIIAGLAVAVTLVQSGCGNANAPEQVAGAPATSTGAQSTGGSPTARSPDWPVIMPEGTSLAVRTASVLSTDVHRAGQFFTAYLDQPLILNGREVVPRGAEVTGMIVDSSKGGRVQGRATLGVRMTRLNLANGGAVDISTNAFRTTAQGTKKKDAAKIGIGAGAGAVVGAVAGGRRGAAIGTAAGAGAGTGVVVATHGDPAVIPSETVLRFALSSPITVTASR
jgi:hypothetical protein